MDEFLNKKNLILSTIARMFAVEGETKIVALLSTCDSKLSLYDTDSYNYESFYYYCLDIMIDLKLYSQLKNELNSIINKINGKINSLVLVENCSISNIRISPKLVDDDKWQEKARDWINGKGITNQGRVRSDNIASRQCDGLLFRSQTEIRFYKALKSSGISFAPLPVFLRGGKEYKRIEPDFFLFKDGVALIVEVDGDTIHTETPTEAHYRTVMLTHEGVHIERIKASELANDTMANEAVKRFINLMDKHKKQ
ncbi:hypothetical protein AN1V17_42120 [Vallitalea sediminicola]